MITKRTRRDYTLTGGGTIVQAIVHLGQDVFTFVLAPSEGFANDLIDHEKKNFDVVLMEFNNNILRITYRDGSKTCFSNCMVRLDIEPNPENAQGEGDV